MTWVRTAPEASDGRTSSPRTRSTRRRSEAHLRLCRTIMFGDSPLTRSEREAIAVAVSSANDCHY
ncbi:MAG: carboxymuconolactone decarboxylase family protein [Gaiellaceae bacterium]